MCPACIATAMTLWAAGSASTGGLTALVARKIGRKTDSKTVMAAPAGQQAIEKKMEERRLGQYFKEPKTRAKRVWLSGEVE